MYAEVIAWSFAEGTHEAVRQTALRVLLPAVKRQSGFRCWLLVRSGSDAYLTVTLFETRAAAEQGLRELMPLVRTHQGRLVESMERYAGEVEGRMGI
jgi:heme-degrading monooxygenase HmoA